VLLKYSVLKNLAEVHSKLARHDEALDRTLEALEVRRSTTSHIPTDGIVPLQRSFLLDKSKVPSSNGVPHLNHALLDMHVLVVLRFLPFLFTVRGIASRRTHFLADSTLCELVRW
jgi:hypothetical protein